MSAPLAVGVVCARPGCGHGEDLHDGICFGTECECVRFVGSADVLSVPVGPERPPFPPAPRTFEEKLGQDVARLQDLLAEAVRDAHRARTERDLIRERVSEPFGCKHCGVEKRSHGRRYIGGQGMHAWERPSDEQVKARMLARRVARSPLPVVPELEQLHDDLAGANLARWEEEQDNERLRLALASAKRGRHELRETVRQMCNELNGFDCPPPGETPLQLVTRVSIAWGEAERRIAELEAPLATARTEAIADVGDWLDEVGEKGAAYLVRTVDIPAGTIAEPACPCPPEDPPTPHQVGCFFDGVPVSPPSERPVDGPSPLFPTVASLREVSSREEPHDSPLHHDWRLGHDLPTGGEHRG